MWIKRFIALKLKCEIITRHYVLIMPQKTKTKNFECEIEFENVFMKNTQQKTWSYSYPMRAYPIHALIPLHTH